MNKVLLYPITYIFNWIFNMLNICNICFQLKKTLILTFWYFDITHIWQTLGWQMGRFNMFSYKWFWNRKYNQILIVKEIICGMHDIQKKKGYSWAPGLSCSKLSLKLACLLWLLKLTYNFNPNFIYSSIWSPYTKAFYSKLF